MTRKLPVFATLGEAFTMFRCQWRRILPYVGALAVALLAVVVVATMIGAGAMMMGHMGHQPITAKLGPVIILFVLMFGFGVVTLPVSTSLQRLAVQGEGARFGFAYRREEWLSLWAMVRLMGGLMLMILPIMILFGLLMAVLGDKNPLVALPFLLLLPVLFFMYRLIPVITAAANGETLSLLASFRLTRGNSWRLIGLIILSSLPFSILMQIVKGLMGDGFVTGLLVMLVSLLSWVYQALILGLAYKHFRDVPTDVQPEETFDAEALPDPVI